MKFPIEYIYLVALLSVILIASYPILLWGKAEYLWGSIRGGLRKIYYLSIFLVLLGFVPFAIYLLENLQWTRAETIEILKALITLIVASWLWIWLSIQFAEKRWNLDLLRLLISLILLIVSLSILYLIYILYQHFQKNPSSEKWLIYLGLGYALFHTFFLDFILWAYLVLYRKR